MRLNHGNNVVAVSKKDSGEIIENCDGLITKDTKIYLKVSAADCLPIAIFDPFTNSIGLVHAGWRGLENGVIENAVSLMKEKYGSRVDKIVVFVGPYICQRHYEVKDDVYKKFLDYPSAIKSAKGKTFLDLGAVAKKQLASSGVKSKNIQFDGRCTFEDKTLCSFRRGDVNKHTYFYLRIP